MQIIRWGIQKKILGIEHDVLRLKIDASMVSKISVFTVFTPAKPALINIFYTPRVAVGVLWRAIIHVW